MFSRRRIIFAAAIALVIRLLSARAADDVVLVKGDRIAADVSGGAGQWSVGGTAYKAADVLCIRFSPDPAPDHIPAGVFVRGGSLLTGMLLSRKGDSADISSNVFGAIKIKKEDVAGAFFPPPADHTETMPELSRYASLQAAALGSPGALLKPGQQCRLRILNGDDQFAERVSRIDSEKITIENKDGKVDPINRSSVRLVELSVPPLPPSAAEDERYGPETIVRLKSGDILRGRVLKLNDKALVLRTLYMGEKTIERNTLAALFLAGGSGLTWLSAQAPAKNVFTPLFDSDFPAHMDLSVDGGNLQIGTLLCERGIGVHSRSQLSFTLSGAPATFIAVVGIDAETKGRGEVSARVLADGKEVWSAASISAKDPPKIVSVNLGPAKTLELEVDYGADGDDSGDHLDWGWAAVTK
jgi:hypothetical protein